MNGDLFKPVESFQRAIDDLERDLRNEGGPQISTMRNYRIALLVYRPEHEFRARRQVARMVRDLETEGWRVLTVDIAKTLHALVRAADQDAVAALIAAEKRNAKRPERALNHLSKMMTQLVGGVEGLAKDIVRQVKAAFDARPEDSERTLVLLGRTGAMYPWFRVSALLKELGPLMERIPVVILYPGERTPEGLRFLGEFQADGDYRPRIYA